MSSTSTVSDSVQDLHDDMAKLRGDIGGLFQTFIDMGKAEAGEVRAQVENKARRQIDALHEAVEYTRRRGEEAVGMVGHKVEEYPMTTLLGAVGVGFLIGMMIDRSSRR